VTLANRTPPKLTVIDFGAPRAESANRLTIAGKQTVRAEDDLVSLRSHELRTPLASMVGFAELIESGDLTDEQRQLYAGILLREGRRLNALIENALALQRLESGHRAMDIAPVDVHSLVARAVLAAGADDRRPIRVRLPKLLPLVAADTEAILEVLANFLSNARRFSPDGGAIDVGARQDGQMVALHIQDRGVGITAEALPSLFRKFYRADSDVRSLGPGSGLGLAMNHRIVAAHGGRVEVGSKGLGKGARFQFSLPVSQPGAGRDDVLVVEDDAGFASLLKAEFAANGTRTIRAADGETAAHMLKGMTPRAIVLDLKLPGVQGEDLLAGLVPSMGTLAPLVVLTVKDLSPAEVSALEAAGAMAVLPKEAGAPQAAVALILEALALGGAAG
jgi:nitrogen-specific signal transduction histidine kinase/CheY-like chemotaxis protein